MRWPGKIIGTLIGLLIGGFYGAIFGFIIGHFFDLGYFDTFFRSFGFNSRQATVQQIFFNSTFRIMGYVAKSDGRVSENEIHFARLVMDQMGLSPQLKREAIALFNEGKQPNFNLLETIDELKQACWQHPTLLQTFLEIQFQTATADGYISAAKRKALEDIWILLGVQGVNFDDFEQQFRGGQSYQKQSRYSPDPQQHVEDAYAILGITSSVSDAEVKKAYRRMMSKHHPDKLMAAGVPPEMIKIATQKTQQIKKAYETIKSVRNI